MTPTHLSLFTGARGMDKAAEMAGFTTVGQCEIDEYANKLLMQQCPDIPKWRDVREFTAEDFFAKTGLRTVDVLSGGDPCQPSTVAGLRLGKADPRYMWPAMFSAIQSIRPTWIVNENVQGSISNGILDEKISNLEKAGYTCRAYSIPAIGCGSPQERYRVILVAYNMRDGSAARPANTAGWEERITAEFIHRCEAHGSRWRYSEDRRQAIEPGVGRVVDGCANRVDRLRLLGNMLLPEQVYPIFQAIYLFVADGF